MQILYADTTKIFLLWLIVKSTKPSGKTYRLQCVRYVSPNDAVVQPHRWAISSGAHWFRLHLEESGDGSPLSSPVLLDAH